MFKRVSHLAFQVSDMQKSLDFYTNGLGFTHAFSIEHEDGRPWIEYIKVADGQFVELFYPGEDFSSENRSYMHLCLEADDCAKAAAALEAKGIDVWAKPSRGKDGNIQCWISDPDGHKIEIMQLDPASPQMNC